MNLPCGYGQPTGPKGATVTTAKKFAGAKAPVIPLSQELSHRMGVEVHYLLLFAKSSRMSAMQSSSTIISLNALGEAQALAFVTMFPSAIKFVAVPTESQ